MYGVFRETRLGDRERERSIFTAASFFIRFSGKTGWRFKKLPWNISAPSELYISLEL